MPKRTDIHSIMIIGAGPIVIGQACEFDYSGAQACKALKAEGYRVILVNSNPATIMTDPGLADATYIEPITPEIVEKIIAREKPGRAAADHGRADRAQHRDEARQRPVSLERHGVELIGARADVIDRAEDRLKFRDAMAEIGIESPAKRHRPLAWRKPAPRSPASACPPSSAPASPWAAPAAASPTTGKNSSRSSPAAWKPRPPPRC